MGSKILFWKILKLLNLNHYFRKHLRSLKFIGRFYYRRIVWMQPFFYEVNLIGYKEDTHEYVVREVINKKDFEIKEDQIYLNRY